MRRGHRCGRAPPRQWPGVLASKTEKLASEVRAQAPALARPLAGSPVHRHRRPGDTLTTQGSVCPWPRPLAPTLPDHTPHLAAPAGHLCRLHRPSHLSPGSPSPAPSSGGGEGPWFSCDQGLMAPPLQPRPPLSPDAWPYSLLRISPARFLPGSKGTGPPQRPPHPALPRSPTGSPARSLSLPFYF